MGLGSQGSGFIGFWGLGCLGMGCRVLLSLGFRGEGFRGLIMGIGHGLRVRGVRLVSIVALQGAQVQISTHQLPVVTACPSTPNPPPSLSIAIAAFATPKIPRALAHRTTQPLSPQHSPAASTPKAFISLGCCPFILRVFHKSSRT